MRDVTGVILITDTGHENLSDGVAMDIDGIERVMREPGLPRRVSGAR